MRQYMLRCITGILIALLAGATARCAENTLTDKEKSEGWQLLFDGKTTTGWMTPKEKPLPLSHVQEGSLNPHPCDYMLVYEKPLKNFELSLDFKISPKCNSGIFIRTAPLMPRPGKDVGFNGLEIAIDDTRGAGFHDTGAIYDLVKPSKNAMRPAGEWNHIQITSDRNLIAVEINGEKVTRMDLDEWPEPNKRPDGSQHKFDVAYKTHPRKGYIGLQDHGSDCWFRNIKLKTLDAADKSSHAGWKLIWSDEFDGAGIDRGNWDFDIGNGFYDYDANMWIGGWGNGELQYYTRAPENAFVKDGLLHIRAVRESYLGCGYTSARLKTRKSDGSALFSQKYGRFEFRARLPGGQGLWPALWMLPQDEKYGGWPVSGEIDVVEARGQDPTRVSGALHFGSRWPENTFVSNEYVMPRRGTTGDFHLYALEWEPGEIRWYVDDQLYSSQSFWWSSKRMKGTRGSKPLNESDLNSWPAPFDQPFYLVMNVAVGGKFPGNPDKTTAFPAEMIVDFVNVYEKVGGYGKTRPRGEGKLPFEKP